MCENFFKKPEELEKWMEDAERKALPASTAMGKTVSNTFPSRFIHTLDGFEDASVRVYTKMNLLLEQSEDTEVFLNILQKKSEKIRMEENQKPGEI